MSEICAHCGVVVEQMNGFWAHRIGEGSYLNRCQSAAVPYGHEAHPGVGECPYWCLGHHEKPFCTHKTAAPPTKGTTVNDNIDAASQGEELALDLSLHILGPGAGELRMVGFMPDTFRILLDFDINEDDRPTLEVVASVPADTNTERLALIIEALESTVDLLRRSEVLDGLVTEEARTNDKGEGL
jgi:hypothetical protein